MKPFDRVGDLRLGPVEARLRAERLLAPGRLLPIVLDLARGIAALMVLLFHIRTWLLVPYAEAQSPGVLASMFYLVSTFGHDGVIIFFVLSGFLIGGAVLRIDFAKPAATVPYAAARIARIAPVLLGAVAFSIAAQALSGPWRVASTCSDTTLTILGNLLALSNLGVAPLCNNLPLWSLSNEVAYYIAFPTAVALIRGVRSPGCWIGSAGVLAICLASLVLTPWDQQNLVLYFPAWLAGAALWWVPPGRVAIWPGILALLAALAFGRMELAKDMFLLRDLLTTFAFTLLLAGLFGRDCPKRGYAAQILIPVGIVASATASISFSLYVIHNPVIDLYAVWALGQGQALPIAKLTGAAWGIVGGLFAASLAVATLFSLAFEAHHRTVAAALLAPFRRRPASANS